MGINRDGGFQSGESDLISKVFITGKTHHPDLPSVVGSIVSWMKQRGRDPIIDSKISGCCNGNVAALPEVADGLSMVIVLGGDGTILGTVRKLEGRQVPLLGVNLGGLGFLAETSSREIPGILGRIAEGRYCVNERMMLDCRVLRGRKLIGKYTVLNDAVINKGALARIIGLEVKVGGNYLTRYRSDGLIISTPTGSTAYSMAAGGPIIYPMMDAIILTPICAHILANRPIVIPPAENVTISLESGGEDAVLTLDGQEGLPLNIGDKVEVVRSKKRTFIINDEDYDYFKVLRCKLKWGEW